MIGWPRKIPCSLRKATTLPDRVTSPIKVPNIMENETAGSMEDLVYNLVNSDAATMLEAPPPSPLKIATS